LEDGAQGAGHSHQAATYSDRSTTTGSA